MWSFKKQKRIEQKIDSQINQNDAKQLLQQCPYKSVLDLIFKDDNQKGLDSYNMLQQQQNIKLKSNVQLNSNGIIMLKSNNKQYDDNNNNNNNNNNEDDEQCSWEDEESDKDLDDQLYQQMYQDLQNDLINNQFIEEQYQDHNEEKIIFHKIQQHDDEEWETDHENEYEFENPEQY